MKKHLKGQFYLAFLTLAVPVFLLMMVVVVDFGNFLTMRSMATSTAEAATGIGGPV
ncbi:MAG: pilus assembly protein [Flexilinea sp.]|nr:pilus assembly protein [Flexilinea sp.]